MENHSPVIAGVSIICSLGLDLDDVIRRILHGESRFSTLPFESRLLESRRVALVEDFNPRDHVNDAKSLRFMSRETRFSVCALVRCLKDAKVTVNETYGAGDIALFSGTGSSGINLDDIQNLLDNAANDETGQFDPVKFGQVALNRLNPLTSFKILPNMPPSVAAIQAGIKGANLIFNPWEGNALLALSEAMHEVTSRREEIVFCGGSDCKTHSNAFVTFIEYGLLNDEREPVLSEGSAWLAVEACSRAEQRNADMYCKISHISHRSTISWSETSGLMYDYPCSEPLFKDMIKEALRESGLAPKDIDMIVSSNDGGKNDPMENHVVRQIFDDCLVISPKKIIGNAFAASGIMNVAIAAYILKHGSAFPEREIHRALVHSFAPGSEHFCIVLEAL